MHREIQIKQFPIVTTHWWPKTRNERFVWENEQYLYRFLPLVHNHVQVIWVHTHPVCDVCVCARSGSRCIHTGRRRQRLTEGVSEAWCWRAVIVTTTNHILLWCCMNGIGYLHEAIWFADASVGAWKVEKLSTSAASSASEATRRDGPTIQFGKAWRDSIQSQREALTPTPRVNGALVCVSAGKRWKWSLVRIRHSLPERAHTHVTHRMCVHTQITWTWLCTRGKKLYKYCSFSHTNRSFRVLGHQCVVTMGNCLIWISLCMFFSPLIETVTYTCHYMTDRLERFDQGWTGTKNRPWHFLVQAAHHHHIIYIYIWYTLPFKSFWTVRFFNIFFKEVSSVHQACICLIQNTAKTVILWNVLIFKIYFKM